MLNLPRQVTLVGEKRTQPQSSRVGNSANIRPRVMPSYPPGFFRHAAAQRVGVQRRTSYRRSRYSQRRKYPRAGARRIAMRPRAGAVVPSEVKRQYSESQVQVWPRRNAVGAEPARSLVYCPFSYQFWQRGLSDSQFSGSKVTLKNISCMMQLVPPVITSSF
eukprot:SAG11_NODE_12459_length_702_cov_1.074627_1_plen_161_part_01